MSKTRDHAQLEKRRLQAGKLFAKGHSAPEVARGLGVARPVAYRWQNAWQQGGRAALASKGPAGPKPKLTVQQTQQVVQALLAGQALRQPVHGQHQFAALFQDRFVAGKIPGLGHDAGVAAAQRQGFIGFTQRPHPITNAPRHPGGGAAGARTRRLRVGDWSEGPTPRRQS